MHTFTVTACTLFLCRKRQCKVSVLRTGACWLCKHSTGMLSEVCFWLMFCYWQQVFLLFLTADAPLCEKFQRCKTKTICLAFVWTGISGANDLYDTYKSAIGWCTIVARVPQESASLFAVVAF